ncbi:MAG: DUF599 domain-containing protein, partial [Gammaproteobacteria bacterium]
MNLTAFDQSLTVQGLALGWFLLCWIGYHVYAKEKSRTEICLASVMHMYRRQWMTAMIHRENRIVDTTAIANLERYVGFFASSTLLILAGLITMLGWEDRAIDLFSALPLATPTNAHAWEFKIALLLVMFVYAFFKFTWSLRLFGFASTLIGAAPLHNDPRLSDEIVEDFSERGARIISMGSHHFNFGLRAYYFALAVLAWFIATWAFVVATALVVVVLYRRE